MVSYERVVIEFLNHFKQRKTDDLFIGFDKSKQMQPRPHLSPLSFCVCTDVLVHHSDSYLL